MYSSQIESLDLIEIKKKFIEDETETIFNKKYKKIYQQPIGVGAFGCVYLVKNIFNNKKYLNHILNFNLGFR